MDSQALAASVGVQAVASYGEVAVTSDGAVGVAPRGLHDTTSPFAPPILGERVACDSY